MVALRKNDAAEAARLRGGRRASRVRRRIAIRIAGRDL